MDNPVTLKPYGVKANGMGSPFGGLVNSPPNFRTYFSWDWDARSGYDWAFDPWQYALRPCSAFRREMAQVLPVAEMNICVLSLVGSKGNLSLLDIFCILFQGA